MNWRGTIAYYRHRGCGKPNRKQQTIAHAKWYIISCHSRQDTIIQ